VGAVKTTFFVFLGVFALFLVIEIRIMIQAFKKGPEIDEAVPVVTNNE
jgi:cytochrome bd-type quinol oxidase subunit 1